MSINCTKLFLSLVLLARGNSFKLKKVKNKLIGYFFTGLPLRWLSGPFFTYPWDLGFLLMSAFMRLVWGALDWLFLLINWTKR